MAPFVSVIEKPGEVDFKWLDGGHDAKPPKGFENYFGAPPHYRFINFDGISAMDDTLEKIREMPDGLSAEEAMRSLLGEEESYTAPAVISTLGRLIEIIDADPEIEVSLAYTLPARTVYSWRETGRNGRERERKLTNICTGTNGILRGRHRVCVADPGRATSA